MSKSFGLTGLPSDLLTDDREFIRRIALVTSGATAQKAAEYSASEIRIGWPAGTVLWYVYNPIVTNEATSGHTEIIWEQR